MYTCGINYTTKTKYLYIPNKCCEMTKHIIKEEKIFTEKTNMLEGISI
jgi:hypothetical protein